MGVWASENSALQNTKAVILRRGRGGIAIVILISVFFILALFSFPSSSIPYDVSRSARSNFNIHAFKDNLNHIRNSTLGFQKIFGINLPERSDKRDATLLQGKVTNFTIDWVDGVVGSEVSPKALPYGLTSSQTFERKPGSVGCWRAHLNIYTRMIEQGIQTALILEDDADWDIGLKSQLVEFARGSRWLLDSDNKAKGSPYGDNWDILWFGHCHSEARRSDNRRWVIPHDPTVPPRSVRTSFQQPDMSPWEQGDSPDLQTRIVHRMHWGYCTAGYAISLRGAERMVYAASLVPNNKSIDMNMGDMCAEFVFPDFTCIAPFPRLIGVARAAGSTVKNSDIADIDPDKAQVNEKDRTENLMFSVRHNIRRILNGETTFHSFFSNPSGDLLTLGEITRARGHPETLKPRPKKAMEEQKEHGEKRRHLKYLWRR
ncbi:hypothetical protein PV05_07264 [Exophiala xenobiotica]|uniref:Glycosyl transferase family 25 domain-containing protein n=1 Tax=Exophiala xenobiotica TaxID=348802 RepID=A0A0D2F4Z3_9EURO|nr:uncharacterized protein PV05_07264 [Exophiala xenobiotica]KIW54944.1 hypothetical protein PV05_07264 [Exophiala xenobiotica]